MRINTNSGVYTHWGDKMNSTTPLLRSKRQAGSCQTSAKLRPNRSSTRYTVLNHALSIEIVNRRPKQSIKTSLQYQGEKQKQNLLFSGIRPSVRLVTLAKAMLSELVMKSPLQKKQCLIAIKAFISFRCRLGLMSPGKMMRLSSPESTHLAPQIQIQHRYCCC